MPLNGFFDTDRDIILMKLVLVFVIFCCGFCPQVNGHESKKIDWLSNDEPEESQHKSSSNKVSTTVKDTTKLLMSSLTQYDFNIGYYQNASISRLLKKLPNSCAPNRIRTPERLKTSIYSSPLNISLDFRLYYRADVKPDFIASNIINKENKLISLAALFNANPNHTLAIDNGRSLGQFLDQQIQQLSERNLVIRNSDESTTSLIKMLLKNRIDYIIDYPTSVHAVLNKLAIKTSLNSLKIANSPGYILGYVACHKGDIGQKAIKDVNKALQKLYRNVNFYQAHTRYLASRDIADFNQIYQAVFKVAIPSNSSLTSRDE
jgi:uncharacterized protein (TIGR02285 family)